MCEDICQKTTKECETKKCGNIHIGKVWESYPYFDSPDFATKTRSYQNYLTRTRPITNRRYAENIESADCWQS